MTSSSNFQDYLQSLCTTYEQWWEENAFIEEIKDAWFEFVLDSKTKSDKPVDDYKVASEHPQEITKPVLSLIEDYRHQKILVVGSPGAGKSTLLKRLLRDAAQKAQNDEQAPIPVFVELKDYKTTGDRTGVRGLLLESLESHDPALDEESLKRLLAEKRLLLLADGLNELSHASAKAELKNLCRHQAAIATSRFTSDWWDIDRKLEIQPLTPKQVKQFLEERLPNRDRAEVEKLGDRVRDFGQTPLMVWMLYSIFQANKETPATRGEAYRSFTALYVERAKAGIDLAESRFLLSKLAFEMMQSQKPDDPTRFSLDMTEVDAQNRLGSAAILNQLLNLHLLQASGNPGNREIRFCHQTLQEYYAAEALLERLQKHPEWLERKPEQKWTRFQQDYLNYLKWTEAIALMLSFPEVENQAEKLVNLALDVDLKLSARLAGEVKPDLQIKTVRIIAEQKVPEWFKIFLLGETKSPKAIDELMQIIKHSDPNIRRRTVWASRQLDIELVMPLIGKAIKDPNPGVRETTIRAVAESDIEQAVLLVAQILPKESVASVREAAVICVLGKSESEAAILTLLQATQDKENNVRVMAAHNLKNMNRKILLPVLTRILKNKINDPAIREISAKQLGELGDKSITRDLLEVQLDLNSNISKEATYALQEVRNRLNREDSSSESSKEDQRKRQVDDWLVYLKSEEPILRGNAVLYLTSLLEKEVAVDLARQALDDPHHYVRGHAITNLGKLVGADAIPQAIRALDDPHYEVRDQASQALVSLGESLPNKLEIPKDTISNLIQTLNEEQDTYVCSKTVTTLTNLCNIRSSLLLNENLESAFLNASNSSDGLLRSTVARSLGKFSSEKVANKLLQMVEDSDFTVALAATEALKNMPLQVTVQYLPDLIAIVLNSEESFVLDAILYIQPRCGFYNYDVAQAKLHQRIEDGGEESSLHDKLDTLNQEVKKVSEEPKRIINTQNYFEKGTHTHTHNYGNDETLKQEITDLSQLVSQLQQNYQPTTEAEAIQVIDVEFHEIQKTNPNRWQAIQRQVQLLKRQLLNPERHLTASKAAIAEVAKHYLEDSVLAKALITYIDTMSADTDQGE